MAGGCNKKCFFVVIAKLSKQPGPVALYCCAPAWGSIVFDYSAKFLLCFLDVFLMLIFFRCEGRGMKDKGKVNDGQRYVVS